MNRRDYLGVLIIITLLAFLSVGCEKAPKIDSFIRGVVVEKSPDGADCLIKVTHLPDSLINETIMFVIILQEDAVRPLKVIWPRIDIGSHLAFEYLTEKGVRKYNPDNICTMTTADIVLLDRPSDFDQMATLAAQKKKQKMLEEQRELEALRDLYQQVSKKAN